MTTEISQVDQNIRLAFRYFNRFMLLLWRLGLGSWFQLWPEVTGQVLVITHIGRKTGLRRQTPANYAVIDGEIYCTAAFGAHSDWYLNTLKNPNVEVWLPDGWWVGVVEDVSDHENRTQIMREVIISSGFAAYTFGINPQCPDEKLEKVTHNYRLIRIRRTEARTGKGGPGDLAWVWPLATFLLLPLVFRRRKR
jgi:deazaflavin-dependent oxidoreductase (nitroreductase family)